MDDNELRMWLTSFRAEIEEMKENLIYMRSLIESDENSDSEEINENIGKTNGKTSKPKPNEE